MVWVVSFTQRVPGVLKHPIAHLVGAPTDQAQDRRPVIGVGAFALAFHPEGTRRVGAVGRQGRDGAYFFSPAF